MSKENDEKVVSMKFDNKDFMNKTEETMTRLDKLKASLRLTDAAKGFDEVGKAANNVNLDQVGTSAEQVSVKFSALQTMATTALVNITNSAVNAGKRIVSALTIDPIKTGLQEYETQINAVQTILANTESKGTTLDDVNKALDELNTYADKTIYNFTEMTRNIGTFTAAGVDLDTATNAIQGIANLAAVSGSNSQQASTAMYQLSQALSSGTVKLMDWNSVVNAGMGGQVFQDALKETARVHDIAIDDMIEEEGSFRETLKEGWLTSEILTETLEKFTMSTEGLTEAQIEANRAKLKSIGYDDEQIDGIFKLGNTATNAATKVKTFTQLMDTLKEAAQSGWTQTWEILIGDFEEAKKLWTSVSDVFNKIIGDSAEARNALLQGWADGGGRQAMLDSFVNVWKALLSIIKPIKEAFREIFPPTTSEQLIKITEAIRDFTSKLILSEHTQEKLKSTFKGLFAVLDIGVHIIKEIGKGAWTVFKALLGVVTDLLGGVNNATGSFGDWLVKVRDSIKSSTLLTTVINGIVTVLLKVVDGLKAVVNYIKESGVLSKIVNGITYAFTKLWEVIKSVYSYLKENVKFPGLETFLTIITAIWTGIKYVFGKIKDAIGDAGSAFMNAFRKGDFKAALDIFNGGIVAGILLGIKNFTDGFGAFKGGIKSIIKSVTGILDSVRGCFEAYQSKIKAAALMEIAKAIALLTASIVVLALIDGAKVDDALATISMLFIELMASMAIMNRIGGGEVKIIKVVGTLVGMSFAVLLLASALKKMSSLELQEMSTGFIGLAGLAAIVILFAKTMTKQEKTIFKGATSLIAFALSLKILITACKDLSQMSWADLTKGLIGLAGLMTMITLFVNKTRMKSALAKTAQGLLILSVALKVLASVCADLGAMSWESLGKGLLGVVAILLTLAAAVKLMPRNMNGIAMNLLAVSAAVAILSKVMTSMASMSIGEIGKGLLAIGGALAILAIALNVMKGTLAGTAAMLLAAVALNAMVIPLRILGSMSLTAIGIALLALAGTFAVFGIAGLLLGPLVPVILALAGAIALMGIGIFTTGAGIAAFASGLMVLGAAAAAGAAGLVAALGIILTGIIGLGAVIAKAVATLISGICEAIVKAIGPLCDMIASVIVAVCDAIVKALPSIVKVVCVLLDALLDIIVKYVPKIIKVAIDLIVALLDGISQKIDDIVAKGVEIVVNLIKGIASQVGPLIDAAFELILSLINGIADAIETYLPQLMEACTKIGTAIVKGIVKGLGSVGSAIWDGIKSVGNSIINGFKSFFGINSPAKTMIPIGQGLDEGMVVGLEEYKGKVVDASEDVGSAAIESMSNAISGISDVIDSDIDSQPTIRPVLDLSAIESGASAINSMFGMTPSVDVLSNVGAINSSMNGNQNGGNFDIISAIKDLGSKIGDMGGNTYIIDGITYDDGSNVANAVESIMRAARIERRI